MVPKVSPELRDAVKHLGILQSVEAPLAKEVLLAFHLGKLSESETEAVRERIVWDDQAVAYLKTLRNPDKTAEVQRSQLEVDEDWETLKGLIASEPRPELEEGPGWQRSERSVDVVTISGQPTGSRWLRSPLPFQLLAAGLSFVSLGLWWQLDRAQNRIADLVAPRANPAVVDLIPVRAQGSTRDPFASLALQWSEASDILVLLLNYTDFRPFDAYQGDLLQERGEVLELRYRFEHLERAGDGSFQIVLHREWALSGDYEFRLIGISNGTEENLVSYQFSVNLE